ncbi:methyltransferase [Pseudomonas typographi]|uniref:methyltransferase n=1 Tax=Pseudomonas typographi TaxID=2715964 RepID=UPI001688E0B2|nr:methyltransferase [Pseudomonas typographi]MBD1551903.1 methyltransferase [Pseudomonas typographi]MBD1589854.1 methyltransferase [Pseudomonas typographi]
MAQRSLQAHFEALDAFLLEHQPLWRPRPFMALSCPWEAQLPELASWLRGRSLEQAEADQPRPYALPAPAPYPALAARAQQLCELAELPRTALHPAGSHAAVDVPGRKWQQIEAFAGHLAFSTTPRHWLDWCAGKGHLARRLVQGEQRATCLELAPALVAAGQALSLRQQRPVAHRQQDVMAASAVGQLAEGDTPVALHACGDLHVRLMAVATEAGCRQLAIAPCCYNRTQADTYQALSTRAQRSTLLLARHDLALVASEAVTAGRRVCRQRDTSMARRLGFDLWQRQLRGEDSYLPTPSLPASWQALSMRQWCMSMAALKGLQAPAEADWPRLEQQGWQRLAQVRNLELLRNLFRRPLELWLALDRALYLQQAGFRVRMGTFCAATLTPRNVLLLAER